MIRSIRLALVAFALAACSSDPSAEPPVEDIAPDVVADAETDIAEDVGTSDVVEDTKPPEDTAPDAEPDVEPDADVGPPPEAATRPRRRMDLDQLRISLARATGTSGWVRSNGTDRFEELAATLGVPDYVLRTAEDLTPSVVFEKFLSDAARDVCTQALQAEIATEDLASRVLLHSIEPTALLPGDEAAIRDNLAYLLLRFHGRDIEPESAEMEPWLTLISTVQSGAEDPAIAWRTVCVGLVMHPAFVSY